jgi:hypothetical protein
LQKCQSPYAGILSAACSGKPAEGYKTRTEWHRIIRWNKLADWAGILQKGAVPPAECPNEAEPSAPEFDDRFDDRVPSPLARTLPVGRPHRAVCSASRVIS